ncbi:MAG: caspase family protein [Spirosomataceae bacterium]
MRYDTLAPDEAAFKNSTGYTFTPFALPVADEDLTLKGVLCKPKTRTGYFNTPEPPPAKQQIVLHFTAGNLSGGMSALTTQDRHVSVAFVLARDGTIYQLFSSKYWSGHIGAGIGNSGTNNARDKVTIGIEIINYGYLVERNGNLETIYSRLPENPGRLDLFCPLTQKEAYQKLDTPFRDQKYYASYTQQQYDSLIILLRFLTKKYGIPRQFLEESKRFLPTQDVLTFKGIVSHINYRPSGKWDIGPAFDWKQVMAGVQAPAYEPVFAQRDAFALETAEELITDEEAIESQMAAPKGVEVAPPEDFESHFNDEEEARKATVKPNLYALLVGINAYEDQVVLAKRVIFPRLRGCVGDAVKVKKYLENETAFGTKNITLLTDQKATKAEVVKAFLELKKAKKDDVVLFYYSGHGTQEKADTSVWTEESDGKHECLVCYYDEQNKEDYLLADKELRYLIQQVAKTKAHVVVLSDCCHSGDNTRNADVVKTSYNEVIERRIPFVFPQRTWDKFIFSPSLQPADFQGKHIDKVLPPGAHIALSACESDESAVEVSGEGIFTKYLIKALETSAGQLTYYALHGRIKQMLNNAFEQTPIMYIPAAYRKKLSYTNVFNKPDSGEAGTYADVLRDGVGNWVLQRGAIHGMGQNIKSITVKDGTKTYEAQVKSIEADTTVLEFDTTVKAKLEKDKTYKGYVEGLLSHQLKIHLHNEDNILSDSQLLTEKLLTEIPDQVKLETEEKKADYTLSLRNGHAVLARPLDPFRPLVEPIVLDSEAFAFQLVKDFKHLSNWHFLKNLRNESALVNPLKIEVTDANGQPLVVKQNTVELHYELKNNKWQGGIGVKITNTTAQKLYFCCVYLDTRFGASLELLDPTVTPLDPGAVTQLSFRGNTTIPIFLESHVRLYNWPKNVEYLQFIVSSVDLSNVEELNLESLPTPFTLKKKATMRSLGMGEDEVEKGAAAAWTTQQLQLDFINPEYNTIRESELEAMLQDENLAEYALGNYFDVVPQPDLQPEYKLKPDVQLRQGEAHLDEKGFIRDGLLASANKAARLVRNTRYRIRRLRFPNTPKIVSEGDSWFQHPLVIDTIDHLSKIYAIYCVAAAGDTLKNYDAEGEWLEAVEEQQPRFFLISGGGNDVLGEQFRGHIKQGPHPTGLPAPAYLEASLIQELDSLKKIYRKMFHELFAVRPDIHVLCHGYDYITPLESTNKGWLGRYMIEKGMTDQADRKRVLAYIIDEFNTRVKDVAAEFPNVHYIDERKAVHDDQWYDEIHPNKFGFQTVAGRFMEKINTLLAV